MVAETVAETSLHRFRHSGVRRMREYTKHDVCSVFVTSQPYVLSDGRGMYSSIIYSKIGSIGHYSRKIGEHLALHVHVNVCYCCSCPLRQRSMCFLFSLESSLEDYTEHFLSLYSKIIIVVTE